ncbi:MAG TPA: hypothetical protein VHO90_22530, partial [Bacteroidales bacterium]|nr:hypothetical protein [Bacteroidales bacterium]
MHKIAVNTKARLTPFWLTHENCGGTFKKVHQHPFDWMECTTCGWDYMWWRNDENLTYPIVSPICTSVFFKSDEIFIYRDTDGDKRDELTYNEMMKARGPRSLLPELQLIIKVDRKVRTQFDNICIEDVNLFHENCGKVCTKFYPYY